MDILFIVLMIIMTIVIVIGLVIIIVLQIIKDDDLRLQLEVKEKTILHLQTLVDILKLDNEKALKKVACLSNTLIETRAQHKVCIAKNEKLIKKAGTFKHAHDTNVRD